MNHPKSVAFLFAYVPKMPTSVEQLNQIEALRTQSAIVFRFAQKMNLNPPDRLPAVTTYRDGIFTRNATFKRAVDRARSQGSDLWLADIGHLLRKSSHANISKAMADLDSLQIDVIDCLSGKKWSEFELPERAAFSREALSRKVASLASGSIRKGQAPDIHNALKGASANRARAERKAEQLRPVVNRFRATLAPGDVITPSMLMRHLNAEGVSPERGKAWSLNSCKNLLQRLQGTKE
ncbi:hypothetical protein [Rhizobium sp. YS-1r]|uniref:hypothetical protein n=1 Tax=Rhizobium sp. YS-1r TaxID=1532558 RepID=UPI00050E6DC3|nr:hypothetical protein [Rhizobium sp. YS-1r]KGD95696.1 hypothetical protein JL39_19750 [Rhizobium sp. YS-1r]